MKYLAAAALVLLALKFYLEKTEDESQHGHLHENTEEIEYEHEHEHPDIGKHTHWHKHSKPVKLTLFGIAAFAFVLGFVHCVEYLERPLASLAKIKAAASSRLTLGLPPALEPLPCLMGSTLKPPPILI